VSSPVDGVGGDLTASAPRSLLPPPLSPGEEEEAPFVSFACVCALRLACAFVCGCLRAARDKCGQHRRAAGKWLYIPRPRKVYPVSPHLCNFFFFCPISTQTKYLREFYMIIHDEMIYLRTVSGSSSYVGLICV
jgi:hypothetical protein